MGKQKNSNKVKKNDEKFHSKHIKHDPQAESARAVFGLNQSNLHEQNKHH